MGRECKTGDKPIGDMRDKEGQSRDAWNVPRRILAAGRRWARVIVWLLTTMLYLEWLAQCSGAMIQANNVESGCMVQVDWAG